MTPRAQQCLFSRLAFAALLVAASSAANAQAEATVMSLDRSLYQLVDPQPLASLAPGAHTGWRIEAAAGLGPRQQLRLSTSAFGLAFPLGAPIGHLDSRATWRYTFYEQQTWAWRVGLTAPLGDRDPRALLRERNRFGSLPMLHFAGEGNLARRWIVGFDADGLMTARGRALEFGLRVSYQLAPNFALTGGYRLSEASGDGEDAYGRGFSNSANVGLRLRF